ncbi:chorismate-binding protein [Burkholderia multivorans]|nr:chorismate-binding protein [Burkholderia multivorans]MBY4792978.1 chorismate-binding protein [Burkholderia multivorans]
MHRRTQLLRGRTRPVRPAAGDADFALAIRSARVTGCEVRVYAGIGIVKGSDPYRDGWKRETRCVRSSPMPHLIRYKGRRCTDM